MKIPKGYKICPECENEIMYRKSTRCRKCLNQIKQIIAKPKKEARTIKHPSDNTCLDCGEGITKTSTRCISCASKLQIRKVPNRPSLEQLESDLEKMSMVKVGQKYGVSDNCIRKWMKNYKST